MIFGDAGEEWWKERKSSFEAQARNLIGPSAELIKSKKSHSNLAFLFPPMYKPPSSPFLQSTRRQGLRQVVHARNFIQTVRALIVNLVNSTRATDPQCDAPTHDAVERPRFPARFLEVLHDRLVLDLDPRTSTMIGFLLNFAVGKMINHICWTDGSHHE